MPENTSSTRASGVSRRGFLKGVGVGTVATGLIGPTATPGALEAESGVVGPGEVSIQLTVNGKPRPLAVEPRVTLLDALRNRLQVTGPKKVCDRGTCGACTVLLDGRPVYACSMLAIEADGHEITTVEGLGSARRLSPLQKAFLKHDASQCGFCTPGFVTASTAFIRKHPNASIEEVRRGLGGNLCRCGTYAGILLAVSEASRQTQGGA